MHPKIPFYFFLLLFTVNSNFSFSQRYIVSNTEDKFANASNDVYYNGVNTILDVNYTSFGKQINLKATTCDYDLKNTRTEKISFNKRTYRFSFFRKELLYFFATDKDESLYKYKINDKDFSVIGSPETMFSYEDDITEYGTVYSPDSSFFSIICKHHNKKEKNETFSGVVLDNTLSLVTKFLFTSSDLISNIDNIKYVISNKGLLNIITQSHEKSGNKRDDDVINYNVTTISKDGKADSKQVSNTIPGTLQNLNWYFNGDDLVFDGIAGESFKKGFTNVVSGNYNYTNKSIDKLKVIEFSTSKSTDLSSKEVSDNGIPSNVFMRGAMLLKDGSSILIYELEANQTVAKSPSHRSYDITFFYGGNSYVIKLNKEKGLEWFHAIAKKQEEPDLREFSGIGYMKDRDDGLHVFFHDNTDNKEPFPKGNIRLANVGNIKKHSLSSVHINSSGKINKTFLLDNHDTDYHMSPGHSYSFRDNELIYIGLKGDYCSIGKILSK